MKKNRVAFEKRKEKIYFITVEGNLFWESSESASNEPQLKRGKIFPSTITGLKNHHKPNCTNLRNRTSKFTTIPTT